VPRALAVTLVALAACLRVASACAAPPAPAEERDRQARTDFAAGRYQEALDIYAQLYADTLHPTYLRNVGRCYQSMGEPDKAISSFREYLRVAKHLTREQRAEVDGFIKEMQELKRSRPPGPALRPPPGDRPGAVASLNARDQGAAPPATHGQIWWWVAGGAAVAAVVVAVLATRSSDKPFCPECGLSTASVPTK